MNHQKILDSISELSHLFRESVTVEVLLDKTVNMLAELTGSDVCSIYLYDNENEILTLRATRGLSRDAVSQVKLRLGEGLTGLCLKERRPVCESDASRSSDFKYFPGIDEELYECFLAVPIKRGLNRIGVLVLQRGKNSCYNEHDIATLESVASALADIIDNARFVMTLHKDEPQQKDSTTPGRAGLSFAKGKVGSEGFAYSPALVLDKHKSMSLLLERDFSTQYTMEDFHRAVEQTAAQLEDLQSQVEIKLSDAAAMIFASHLMILKDKHFIGQIEQLINEGVNPPRAVLRVARQYMQSLAAGENTYMREKIHDVQDLTIRIISNLVEEIQDITNSTGKIVIARQLFPSDLLKLSSEKTDGVVLVSGGVTSHLAILARSLQMPMIIANQYELLDIPNNSPVMLDGHAGLVYINPTEEILEKFESQIATRTTLEDQAKIIKPQTHTRDGTRVYLYANINLLSDLHFARLLKAEGVGLYRTEFPFMIRSDFPTEQEQFSIYRKLIESMPDKPITFRTLDIGGDKVLSYYHNTEEQNPVLGMRSIRFSLQHREIFDMQLRAILRAGQGGKLKIMFPMIASLDDFLEARKAVDQCSEYLTKKNIPHNNNPTLGMMVELPSVVDMIDEFAKEVDFFSIGTNDFVQFMLGVDRTNETVADYYMPHHPAVLRALSKIASAALSHDKEVSVCGDMASNVKYVMFLLGMGIRHFSLEPGYLLRIQQAVSEIDMGFAREVTEDVLKASTISRVSEILKSIKPVKT